MPTSEWNAATSSGIEVIGTLRAITAPMPPPRPSPATTRIQAPAPAGGCAASVVSDRDHHADDAEHVAAAARFRARQPAQRQDEQDARDEIEQRGDIGVHDAGDMALPYFFFFWYIASMRWVTRKPPKILMEANTSATKPSARAQMRP